MQDAIFTKEKIKVMYFKTKRDYMVDSCAFRRDLQGQANDYHL